MKSRINRVYNKFLSILRKPEMRILPGQIAFYFLMSFIPILVLMALITSKIPLNINVINIVKSNLPDVLGNIIISFISGGSAKGGLILIVLAYLLIGLNGPESIIVASNTIYNIKHSTFIKQKVKAGIMTIIIIILLIFMILVPVLGDTIVKFILSLFENPEQFLKFKFVYNTFKIVISFLFVYFVIKLIYAIAPDKKIKSSQTTYGALFTTISWMIATKVFAFYITNLAKYDVLYGNFANILILLMWLYFLAYLFVVGMVLNADYNEKEQIKDGK